MGPEERLRPDRRSPWWGEHRSRYHFAAKWVRGATALDCACGFGFGSRILLEAGADFVVAADIDWGAVKETSRIAQFDVVGCQADGMSLPFHPNSFDVIASFETLEHVADGDVLISELRRVVRDDGLVVLSTPNARYTRPVDGKPRNPFHIHEYDAEELITVLSKHFTEVSVFGQTARSAYRINPYWQHPDDLPSRFSDRLRLLSWRIQHRLPFGMKDRLSRLLHNRSFYPGEYDFVLRKEATDTAHALVAECRP